VEITAIRAASGEQTGQYQLRDRSVVSVVVRQAEGAAETMRLPSVTYRSHPTAATSRAPHQVRKSW
jgi:hypothetical protein